MVSPQHLPAMKRSSTIFLQTVIVLAGVSVLAAMLGEPLTEGRNAHATLVQVYFHDPFLAYAYAASVAFFVGLYQGFTVLGYASRGQILSPAAVKALRIIKVCAFLTACAIAAADAYIRLAASGRDDPAGAMMLGFIAIFAAAVIGTAVAVLERVLQHAVDIKRENDLTV